MIAGNEIEQEDCILEIYLPAIVRIHMINMNDLIVNKKQYGSSTIDGNCGEKFRAECLVLVACM